MRAQLAGQGADEPFQPALGRTVCGKISLAELGENRGHGDDAAVPKLGEP